MDEAARVRQQIRVVLVVYRSEIARLDRWDLAPDARRDFTEGLRERSFEILDDARAALDGDAPEHLDLIRELDQAREEVGAGD